MNGPDKLTARRLIAHLKGGTTPIDCVEFINVGNERWFGAAAEQFEEIQADGDSLVRFIDGYYGDGKTTLWECCVLWHSIKVGASRT